MIVFEKTPKNEMCGFFFAEILAKKIVEFYGDGEFIDSKIFVKMFVKFLWDQPYEIVDSVVSDYLENDRGMSPIGAIFSATKDVAETYHVNLSCTSTFKDQCV